MIVVASNNGNPFSGFGRELLERLREDHQQRLDDVAFEERMSGIENATSAMLELDIDSDRIISMLQKYWDLRRSEANEFIMCQKERIDNY